MHKIINLLVAVFVSVVSFADNLPQRPQPPTLVTDFANVIPDNQQALLERKLVDFFASTSTQIAVVSVDNLEGNAISDYAFRLGEKWGIGSEKFDNGILILIKPKQSNSRGEVFIAVGYGLEGVVPDITTKQIIENEMIPELRRNNYVAGVDKAVSVLIDLTQKEYTAQQYAKNVERGFNPFILFVLIFFVFPILFGRRRKNIYSTGGRSSLPFWLAMGLMGSSRRNHSGFYNDFSSGGGSFGGGSSFGSFGGFGGGGFGGGGAGGSW